MMRATVTKMCRHGFSLAELLAAVTIGAMVLVAVLAIYTRAESSSSAIMRELDRTRLPHEVLQRITEDLDRMAVPGADTKVTVENKFINSFSTARLSIKKTIRGSQAQEQTLEEVVWQGNYDPDVNGLIIYRGHSGIAMEDKLLDEQKEPWERELFVPVCWGVTYFKIQVPAEGAFQDNWSGNTLPPGVVVTISFAPPSKAVNGTWDVPELDKITRTVAVDRTRKIKFTIPQIEDEEEQQEDVNEPNQMDKVEQTDQQEKTDGNEPSQRIRRQR
jgi:prepilin-type N-terminal cleavage/methylation domain-containing protein